MAKSDIFPAESALAIPTKKARRLLRDFVLDYGLIERASSQLTNMLDGLFDAEDDVRHALRFKIPKTLVRKFYELLPRDVGFKNAAALFKMMDILMENSDNETVDDWVREFETFLYEHVRSVQRRQMEELERRIQKLIDEGCQITINGVAVGKHVVLDCQPAAGLPRQTKPVHFRDVALGEQIVVSLVGGSDIEGRVLGHSKSNLLLEVYGDMPGQQRIKRKDIRLIVRASRDRAQGERMNIGDGVFVETRSGNTLIGKVLKITDTHLTIEEERDGVQKVKWTDMTEYSFSKPKTKLTGMPPSAKINIGDVKVGERVVVLTTEVPEFQFIDGRVVCVDLENNVPYSIMVDGHRDGDLEHSFALQTRLITYIGRRLNDDGTNPQAEAKPEQATTDDAAPPAAPDNVLKRPKTGIRVNVIDRKTGKALLSNTKITDFDKTYVWVDTHEGPATYERDTIYLVPSDS